MPKASWISSWPRWSAIAVAPLCLDAGHTKRRSDLHRPLQTYRFVLLLSAVSFSLLSGCRHVGNSPADISIQHDVSWPATAVAEREFPAAEVIIDERRNLSKLWLLSSHESGVAQALEFFSGERVADVRVESIESNFPDERLDYIFAYSSTDGSGHRYAFVAGVPYTVGTNQPSIYGGGKDRECRGYGVALGDYLFERRTVTRRGGMPKGVDTPIGGRPLLGRQSICGTTVYVTRTRVPLQREAELGFVPITKIIADYESKEKCWITLPILAVDLRDNRHRRQGDPVEQQVPVAYRAHGKHPHHPRQGIEACRAIVREREHTTPNLAPTNAEYNATKDLGNLLMPKVLVMSEYDSLNAERKDWQ